MPVIERPFQKFTSLKGRATMARTPVESLGWIPEERESSVINAIRANSAAESLFRRVTMTAETKRIPRGSTVGIEVVAKGAAYGEDVHEYDDITLTNVKLGKMVRLAEEDLDDSPLNIIQQKKDEWASSYAKYIDNATMAVTGAQGAGVPFESVYHVLANARPADGYTAGANIVKVTPADFTYEALSELLETREGSAYFDPAREVVIAHPAFKARLRTLKDGDGRYIFAPSPAQGQPDTILGYSVTWSSGLRTSATATDAPKGNPIIVSGNRDLLILGVRSGPESVVIDGRDGASTQTDETLLKMRARRAFVLGHADGAAILELTPAA